MQFWLKNNGDNVVKSFTSISASFVEGQKPQLVTHLFLSLEIFLLTE